MIDFTCNKFGRSSVKCLDVQEQCIRNGATVKRSEPILSYHLGIYIEELKNNKKNTSVRIASVPVDVLNRGLPNTNQKGYHLIQLAVSH